METKPPSFRAVSSNRSIDSCGPGVGVAFDVVLIFLIAITSLMATASAKASEVPASRSQLIGHPRSRFPLTLYVEAPPAQFDAPINDAVAQWNAVFVQAFAVPAFARTSDKANADVIMGFGDSGRDIPEMGETEVDADKRGVIRLPVTITIEPPTQRGASTVAQVMFDIAAHELGHALGFPHINRPDSIMCCDPGAMNFDDPAARKAYIAARRHPDLRLMLPEIETHYRRFWAEQASDSAAHSR